jgi:hypothetical protein
MEERTIGEIGNYYGSLLVKEEDGKFLWSIPDHSSIKWEEIPKSLYDSLINYEDNRTK